MAAQIISGKILAAEMKQKAAQDAEKMKQKGVAPCLAVMLVGNDPASQVYVKGKTRDCEECGIENRMVCLPETVTQQEVLMKLGQLAEDASVHGILVQLPLPKHINEQAVINAIPPEKDVDGFTVQNIGRAMIGEEAFLPCTPAGCIHMLKSTGVQLAGKHAVVVGRSNIVGKPLAMLLLRENLTVTICHSHTENLAEICKKADVLVSAVGRAGIITRDMVKPGAVVIDVGINRNAEGKLCGDVNFDDVEPVAGYITPVPGGVGLMTRAVLMQNTIQAAKIQQK